MASLNGITLRRFKKVRNDSGEPFYQGELWAPGIDGAAKIAEWKQVPDARVDELYTEPGFSKRKIISNIRKYNNNFFEHNMMMLGSLAEYEHHFRAARKKGYAGVAVMQSATFYICRFLNDEQAGLSDIEIENLLEPEKQELKDMGKADDLQFLVFRKASDFVLGDREMAEMLKENN